MKKDKFFAKEMGSIKSFEFNHDVAEVFDDMVSRSVPFYDEIHRIILDLVDRKYEGGAIYDLGCSTATTISILDKHFKKRDIKTPDYIGIDNSAPMLEKASEKIKKNKVTNAELICNDIADVNFRKSGMIIMNYTLQFIKPTERPDLLKKIYKSLDKGGMFILSEKIKSSGHTVNDLLIELYYDFKRRNGYSELEISQKREALENVLIPITPEKQIELLKKAGFKKVEMIFRWYNFACYLGVK
ncbi:carboxy-S-adenosyl-L-methionine synthase CmoA [Halobacteriovorax sp. JY17]|uniref:carboxy-S-adenosyl-L-methionine synthase CmoA n=1 Tax=Halobacteriovorax sp. JY17 TaxID=2014617 RepID=UPI000C4D5A05|nr:carboxy-S-adenosyl-L-methionine synthase CmoA [Halobacteriovorax sp. JY17]PIK16334.1 MAG: carboxy-S-adenosyl-L-methionine synthase CmoA [Halobacteriovorax sp. JY17]